MSKKNSETPRKEKRRLRKARKQKVRGLHGRIKHVVGNFRLSLTFRIALHYSWQMLKTFLLAALILTIVFSGITLSGIEDCIERVSQSDCREDKSFSQEAIQDAHISAFLLDVPYEGSKSPLEYHVTQLKGNLLKLQARLTIQARHSSGQTVQLQVDLHDALIAALWLLLGILLIDLARIIYFIRHRERLHKTVLAPIRDITELASTLSASNLSNRINIAGTKNELKDLAVVINSMLDRIERSYNSQKQFVSDASHELRTPIAVLQGYINMLSRWGKSDPDVLDEGINAITQETQSMKELVESLLFLARHDKKTLMMEMEAFDALDVLTELHKEAAMVTPEDTFILSPAESCPLEGDRSMIKQVMRILCDNAVKYTPKGGVIQLGIERKPGWITLSVADNGPGITAEDLPKIFDRFYRADAARRSEGGGHGLGLSIARIIVMAHGGKLRVRSKVGSGSTFYVDLPEKQDSLHTAAAVSE
ncbi:MAG: HAMP domain-containing histidine kinase [Clostridia bacterium]|nr:HAMP domain-containing histidine kinase [Clostridia bacterium]